MHAQSILLLLQEEGELLLSDRIYTFPEADSPQIRVQGSKRWSRACKQIVSVLQISETVMQGKPKLFPLEKKETNKQANK